MLYVLYSNFRCGLLTWIPLSVLFLVFFGHMAVLKMEFNLVFLCNLPFSCFLKFMGLPSYYL